MILSSCITILIGISDSEKVSVATDSDLSLSWLAANIHIVQR